MEDVRTTQSLAIYHFFQSISIMMDHQVSYVKTWGFFRKKILKMNPLPFGWEGMGTILRCGIEFQTRFIEFFQFLSRICVCRIVEVVVGVIHPHIVTLVSVSEIKISQVSHSRSLSKLWFITTVQCDDHHS